MLETIRNVEEGLLAEIKNDSIIDANETDMEVARKTKY
jgi:hypothetical protein